MNGKLIIIRPSGSPEVRDLHAEPTLEVMREIVGGYLEIVPFFTTIEIGGAVRACLALCNEEGKLERLPFNRRATLIWDSAMRRAGLGTCSPDYLVGSIAVIVGDDVLRAMRTDPDEDDETASAAAPIITDKGRDSPCHCSRSSAFVTTRTWRRCCARLRQSAPRM
jgi:hypothetical protein